MISENLRKPKKSEVEKTTEVSGKPAISEHDCALRVIVDDASVLKPEGFQRVTESLRNHAVALGQVGGWRGSRRAADAWINAFQSMLGPREEEM